MATTTLPQQRTTPKRGRWIAGGIVLIVLAIIAAVFLTSRRSSATATTAATTPVTSGPIVASVAGTGSIAAAQTLDLAFQTNGIVTELLVKEGDLVETGELLARLDDRDLRLQVSSAPRPASRAPRPAWFRPSKATPHPRTLRRPRPAWPTPRPICRRPAVARPPPPISPAPRPQLRSAQAQLDALKNPSPANLSSAELKLKQAQSRPRLDPHQRIGHQDQRRSEPCSRAADSLTKAQASYSHRQAELELCPGDRRRPQQPQEHQPDHRRESKNKLNDVQQRQYYDTFVQAEASMHSAEQALTAGPGRPTTKPARTRSCRSSRPRPPWPTPSSSSRRSRNPSANDVVQAQASVDQARASLQKLRQGGSSADIAAAQANVDQSQANLEKLTAPATETDLAVQQAAVAQAEQALEQAQAQARQRRAQGALRRHRDQRDDRAGQQRLQQQRRDQPDRPQHAARGYVAERERRGARCSSTQPVTLTIDALKDWKAEGTVSYIAPSATVNNSVVTYLVRVSFPDSDARVKVGMTANVSIVTATKENALLVPNSALLPNGAGYAVQVPNAGGGTREVMVQTGLSDGTQTEIIDGLKAGDQVISNPSIGTTPRSGGFGP